MKNGARYVVTTHWGCFSLDEGSYQDYLAGKLWISWKPGKAAEPQSPAEPIPANVTERAVTLCEHANTVGFFTALNTLGLHDSRLPYSDRLAALGIDELNLTVRSGNGLKRANIHTFAQLRNQLEIESGLISFRNIGQKSMQEIKQVFTQECYARLLPYEKARYWQDILDGIGTV